VNIRRSAAALAAVAAVIGAPASAVAATPSPSASTAPARPAGLYGSTDPTYDGVWRQSLALLAQHTVGVRPAAQAVSWLAGQQCANGAFAAYRAEPSAACDDRTAVDTNSTAAAVQALAALGGHEAATGKAVTWLKSVQNEDGGWGYTPGDPSDANSTSLVVGALAAVGEKPDAVVKDGTSPYDALLAFALPCSGDDGGAFAYQPDKKGTLTANADATAAAVVAALGQGLAAEAGTGPASTTCSGSGTATPARAAANGAAYLARAVAATGHLTSALPGADDQPDYGNTADAVVALAAQGGPEAARTPLRWLEEHAAAWAEKSGPAAWAQLVFAAHATGTDPRDFGGVDLVAELDATGPAPAATGPAGAPGTTDGDGGDGHTTAWIAGGVGAVVVVGGGALLAARRRTGRQP